MDEPADISTGQEQRIGGEPPARSRRLLPALVAGLGVIGLAGLAGAFWMQAETQREMTRLATDVAQLRLSLELYARPQGAPSGTDSAALQDLANRLAILEENWRSAPAATPPAASAAPSGAPSAAASASGGDCLPTGTRFLVAAGDTYPICGTTGAVAIGSVDNGFLSLADGTVIASGGALALPAIGCTLAVVSAGENGMTGYGEIRVTC
ncbi:MAG: hypothetical protein ABS76_08845 [Pelagibacterium sp. SCN 64-44]|nr:MAG: hypothetical protein ABS76_08845 [Pelagibacterium sp. SCN 64-44]